MKKRASWVQEELSRQCQSVILYDKMATWSCIDQSPGPDANTLMPRTNQRAKRSHVDSLLRRHETWWRHGCYRVDWCWRSYGRRVEVWRHANLDGLRGDGRTGQDRAGRCEERAVGGRRRVRSERWSEPCGHERGRPETLSVRHLQTSHHLLLPFGPEER